LIIPPHRRLARAGLALLQFSFVSQTGIGSAASHDTGLNSALPSPQGPARGGRPA
jgi:hypothetical protein